MTAFDLFCRVVDNYGDAGVCWRLARRLADMGHPVRLWIDDAAPLARLVPALRRQAGEQLVEGVRVVPWNAAVEATPPAGGVVVEAFACTPPAAYLARMRAQDCLWINLEYLSAEPWVAEWHGLPSRQANGVAKYFFFPGFTPATGGLLREPGLLARRTQALRKPRRRRLKALTGSDPGPLADSARVVLLFSYPHAPVEGLLRALGASQRPTLVLAPGERPMPATESRGPRVLHIPFVPQAAFDELLWCCDLNCVRGEDSIVRALWAGAPLLWHIYPQDEGAHLAKLEAWLALAGLPEPVADAQHAWNGADPAAFGRALGIALADPCFDAWRDRSRQWSESLARQADMADALVAFCQRKRQTR